MEVNASLCLLGFEIAACSAKWPSIMIDGPVGEWFSVMVYLGSWYPRRYLLLFPFSCFILLSLLFGCRVLGEVLSLLAI